MSIVSGCRMRRQHGDAPGPADSLDASSARLARTCATGRGDVDPPPGDAADAAGPCWSVRLVEVRQARRRDRVERRAGYRGRWWFPLLVLLVAMSGCWGAAQGRPIDRRQTRLADPRCPVRRGRPGAGRPRWDGRTGDDRGRWAEPQERDRGGRRTHAGADARPHPGVQPGLRQRHQRSGHPWTSSTP